MDSISRLGSNQRVSYKVLLDIKNSINLNLVLDSITYLDSGSLEISGRAKSDDAIVLFMDSLRSKKEIKQVSIENMNSDLETKIKEFNIRCILEKEN